MRNIKAVVEYDGTDYSGFQRQPRRRTVQGELERALAEIMKEPVRVTGAGRTDAGVHAAGQVISFKTVCAIPTDRVCVALNSVLSRDIVLVQAEEVGPEFHARYSARQRIYEYRILNTEQPSALFGRFVWHVPDKLNLRAVRKAAEYLLGTHDFAAFSLSQRDEKSTVRELSALEISRHCDIISVVLKANGFLHSMARGIVGTLVEIGQGRRSPDDMKTILEGRDRSGAGKTAPARGLCLIEVVY
ncbi:MAG: tRNA pseudouridine(38-40) synthase TruA [Armatimonadota bacterium]|nr:tRNA pseudouridine(38-40) synthase TruA [Armatimonadota bacterium]